MRMPLIALAVSAILGCGDSHTDSRLARLEASVRSTSADAAKLKEVVALHEESGNIAPGTAKTLNRRLDAIIERAK